MAAATRAFAASAQGAPAARDASGNWAKASSAAARSPRSSAAPIRATGGRIVAACGFADAADAHQGAHVVEEPVPAAAIGRRRGGATAGSTLAQSPPARKRGGADLVSGFSGASARRRCRVATARPAPLRTASRRRTLFEESATPTAAALSEPLSAIATRASLFGAAPVAPSSLARRSLSASLLVQPRVGGGEIGFELG